MTTTDRHKDKGSEAPEDKRKRPRLVFWFPGLGALVVFLILRACGWGS